jgi:hypothetical protein
MVVMMPLTINGTDFRSIKDAAIFYNIPRSTLRYRLKHRLDVAAPIRYYHPPENRRHPYLVSELPEYIKDWLLNSIPEGLACSEYICAIITDAYHDAGAPNGEGTD